MRNATGLDSREDGGSDHKADGGRSCVWYLGRLSGAGP